MNAPLPSRQLVHAPALAALANVRHGFFTRNEPDDEVRGEANAAFRPPTDAAAVTPPDADIVRFLEQESGNRATTVPFGTELPEVASMGAEGVVFGPGDIRVAHRTGEHVAVDEVERCAAILARAIERFCT